MTALARRNLLLFLPLLPVSLVVAFLLSVVWVQPVSAAPAAGNRAPQNGAETNARDKCADEGWQALRYGAIWIADGSYYNFTVNVGASDTTTDVFIAGSVYGCHSSATGDTFAVNITPEGSEGWRLYGLDSRSLYRGDSAGRHNWSSRGGQINATLNVSGLATNNSGRTDTQTIYIDLDRCFSTRSDRATGTCYPETVPVTIIRAARPLTPPTCTINASPNPINNGWSTTISWSSTNASSMTVTGNGNSWSGTSGSQSDSPTTSVTYTGSVTGSDGSATCSRTVTVIQPPTCTMSASPTSYVGGGGNTTTITWNSNGNAMTVRRGGTTLSTNLSGSYTDNQQTAGTYSYTGEARRPGANGTTMYGYCSVNVTVYPPPSCSVSPTFAIPTQTVTFTATGGNPALPYTWSGGYTGNPYTTSYGAAGTYTVTVTNGGITNSCTVYVVNKPYARVYAGDTLAGVGFGDAAGGCPASSITDGKRQLGFTYQAGANYAGGGNSHANIGTADIVEFIAGTLEPGPSNPRILAFENTSGSVYGGDFNTSHLGAACAIDYYSKLPAGASAVPSAVTSVSSLGDGNHRYSGNLRLNAGNIGSGDHVTLYVDGNVFIHGNINYAGSGGYGSDPKNIPSFKLVVRGNIYVDASVSELNGMFIAQPDASNSRGTFYTCGFDRGGGNFGGPSVSSGSGSTGNPYISSEYTGACGSTQLTVYGAVVARDIRLLRSRGTVTTTVEGYPSPGAAERFILTPDTWFNGDPSKSKPFQSYTQLPPIL